MSITLYRNSTVSILVDVTCSARSVSQMPPPRMGCRKPVHKTGEFLSFWPYDEMPVIGHDAIRQQPNRDFSDGLGENRFKRLVILCVGEQALTANGAVMHVDNVPVRIA